MMEWRFWMVRFILWVDNGSAKNIAERYDPVN
jgi:hypothetical protein